MKSVLLLQITVQLSICQKYSSSQRWGSTKPDLLSTGIFQVAVTDLDEQLLNLRVTNVSGQEIWVAEERLIGGTLSVKVDLSRFASGLYFLHLAGAEKRFVQKLEVIR